MRKREAKPKVEVKKSQIGLIKFLIEKRITNFTELSQLVSILPAKPVIFVIYSIVLLTAASYHCVLFSVLVFLGRDFPTRARARARARTRTHTQTRS